MSKDQDRGGSNDNGTGPSDGLNKLWVPLVVAIGASIGFLSYAVSVSAPNFRTIPPFVRPGPFGEQPKFLQISLLFQEFHIVLSTIGIALLVALLVVYTRTYMKTKANFIFGLVIMLFALLLNSILTYPVFLGYFGEFGFPAPFFFSPIADLFTIFAYTVFLYLSLQ
jgi:hypothetical protein